MRNSGFTIVELLIVIVIIGILAAIVIVAYNGITENARASSIADGFKKFEKAMRLYVASEGLSSWPAESAVSSGGLPAMINNVPGFSNYMQSAPEIPGVTGNWRYDNDGDSYNGCSQWANGVNIYIGSFTDGAMAQRVDDIMDDGNLTCGKMRWTGDANNLLYNLSPDENTL